MSSQAERFFETQEVNFVLLQEKRGEQADWSCSDDGDFGLQHHSQVYTVQLQSEMEGDAWQFFQDDIPELVQIMTIQQPQQDLISEHWRSLMTALQIKTQQNQIYVYLIYKNKSSVCFINFKQGSFLYQKTFKINYGQVHEITTLKLQTITIRIDDKPRKQQILVIGFMDGSVQVYALSVGEKVVSLQRTVSFQFWEHNQPVTTIGFRQRNMYVARSHSVWVYRDCLSLIANIIVDELLTKNGPKPARTYDMKSLASPIRIGTMSKGTVLHLALGPQTVHVYNQSQGGKTFHSETIQQKGTIIDSIVLMQQVSQGNVVIADTNDKLKIIYKGHSYVQRYTGFRNYPSAIQHLLFTEAEQLWIGDLHGSITLLTRTISKQPAQQHSPRKLKMVDVPLGRQRKICENGIKTLRICDKLMFVQDCQGNLIVFDVVRREGEFGGDVESVSEESR